MFKIYDLNFKEVSLPVERLGYGMKALDISIGPIIYDTVYSNGNRADTPIKRYPKDREVSINILTTAADTIDWRMKRDQVYTFFRRLGVFYVAESYQPFKLLKVMVDEGYEVDRPVTRWGLAEIPLKIIDTPFKQSLHTTLDIDQEGMQFNDKWAYGMGTLTDEGTWRYSFSNDNPVFYNAGTESVKLVRQKESRIKITVKEATPYIQISDSKAVFSLYRELTAGDVVEIKGSEITLNGDNVMGDTNYNFLTVDEGWNEWEVRNVSKFDFEIDFRFLYD